MMLKIAAENNLSETAFVVPKHPSQHSTEPSQLPTEQSPFEHDTHFDLRWFTPTKEVDLCGHATLATAAVLLQKCGNKNSLLHFATKSGELIAATLPGTSAIEIELPLNPPLPVESFSPSIQTLIELVLGENNEHVVKDIMYSQRTKKLVFELDSAIVDRNFLESLIVSPSALLAVDQSDRGTESSITGVIVTMLDESKEYDFISRYFAPWNGIDEDPVTGSAHTVISPMWTEKLNGQTQFTARQCSPRGGDLGLEVDLNGGRLFVSGNACVVIEGSIRIE
jgi:PhzF family phenazine biosynthesis protein